MPTPPQEGEERLYRLWKARAVPGAGFPLHGRGRLVVVSPGVRNQGPGPDFLGAVLLIDGRLAVGPVEMHCRASEWFAHGHDVDSAYDSVILHVVEKPDRDVRPSLPVLLEQVLRTGENPEPKPLPGVEAGRHEITPGLLAEFSWTRLLRRVTEMLRREAELPIEDRVRRGFLRRSFDCLGYARNREPMQRLALDVLEHEPELRRSSLEEIAALLLRMSKLPAGTFLAPVRRFLDDRQLQLIRTAEAETTDTTPWRFDVRPANAPARRLWAAASLIHALYREELLRNWLAELEAGALVGRLVQRFVLRLEDETLLGPARARELFVNAAIPAALTAAVGAARSILIERACLAYRKAPSLGSNRILREVEQRYLGEERLKGAFWQQGAVEFYQRVLSPDRSGLSMIAEARGRGSGNERKRIVPKGGRAGRE